MTVDQYYKRKTSLRTRSTGCASPAQHWRGSYWISAMTRKENRLSFLLLIFTLLLSGLALTLSALALTLSVRHLPIQSGLSQ